MTGNKNTIYIQNKFSDAVLEVYERADLESLAIKQDALRDVCQCLKDELGFKQLLDVIAIDHLDKKTPRFEVDYLFYNFESKSRFLIKVPVDSADQPTLDSIIDIYEPADWAERECYDMMGISFKGHPNLERLLMWKEFEGYPLRKDYPLDKRQPIPVLPEILKSAAE